MPCACTEQPWREGHPVPATHTLHLAQLLLGNRSAVHAQLGDFAAALADDDAAAAAKPDWPKAHVRRALALQGQGQWREAERALVAAQALDPTSAYIAQQLASVRGKAVAATLQAPCATLHDFRTLFASLTDVRLRLATLATFWNTASPSTRHAIFAQLLGLLAGGQDGASSSAPSSAAASGGGDAVPATSVPLDASAVPHSAMRPLPMHNYADVSVPEQWVAFFTDLEAAQQLALFEAAWGLTSPAEQTLIVNDFKFFFGSAGSAGGVPGMVRLAGSDKAPPVTLPLTPAMAAEASSGRGGPGSAASQAAAVALGAPEGGTLALDETGQYWEYTAPATAAQ